MKLRLVFWPVELQTDLPEGKEPEFYVKDWPLPALPAIGTEVYCADEEGGEVDGVVKNHQLRDPDGYLEAHIEVVEGGDFSDKFFRNPKNGWKPVGAHYTLKE